MGLCGNFYQPSLDHRSVYDCYGDKKHQNYGSHFSVAGRRVVADLSLIFILQMWMLLHDRQKHFFFPLLPSGHAPEATPLWAGPSSSGQTISLKGWMLYTVVKILRAIKILRIENSTSDMPRTWNLDNFRSCMSFVFIRFYGLLIHFCISLSFQM